MLNRVEKDTLVDEPLKIGTLLVNEGFIRNADLEQAIEIQEEEAQLSELPLGKLLVKKRQIDRDQLQTLLQHPELVGEIETFALEKVRIHPLDLARCIEQKPPHQPLAEALAVAGHLTDDDLKLFFRQQLDSLKICELAVETGMASEEDINRVLLSKNTPRTIGEILCDLNLVAPLDLNAVLTKYGKHLRLGEILLKHGLIDGPAFDRAFEIHENRGEPLGRIFLREGILSEDQLYTAFSRQYNIPFERLEEFRYSPGQKDVLTGIMGKTLSDQLHLIPLKLKSSTLTVALSDPRNLEIVNSLRSKRVDLRIQCVLITPAVMERLYVGLYQTRPPASFRQQASPHPTAAPARSEPPPQRPDESGHGKETAAADRARGIQAHQLVHLMLAKAIQADARSIHIDLGLRQAVIRLRTGDSLSPLSDPWPEDAFQEMAGEIIDSIKKIAGMNPDTRNRPQEGMFRVGLPYGDGGITDVDFSVTACPTLAGENMTIQRVGAFEPAPNLDKLRHTPQVISSLKQAMSNPSGMFLVASPPGNSRNSTLYGMLRHMRSPELKAITVETSVSFSMSEAVQIQTNPATDLSCGAMLHTAIRLDPDILLVGELAEPESAALGLEAARKGIRLLAGIHASDAAGAITAIADLGMPPVQTAGLLKTVLAQRWVRKICPDCKQAYTPAEQEWQSLFEHFPEKLLFHRGKGCPACEFSGYRGRILLSELLVVNDAVGRAIKQGLGENHIRHLMIRSGIKTLIDDGLTKLHLTTLQEIIDAVPPEAAEAFRHVRADENAGTAETGPFTMEVGVFGITMWKPEAQTMDIQRLHHTYEVLMKEAGHTQRRSNINAFAAFIKTHHETICRRHGTSRVFFSVKRNGKKAVLLATPEHEG